MGMLRWIHGVSLKDKVIRKTLGVTCITDKIREARLRWYGHVMRREDGRGQQTPTVEDNRRSVEET